MTPDRYPALAAAACLVAGFGAMAAATVPGNLPGPDMWRYWSGTVGDAILLPAIVYGLTRGVTLLPRTHRGRPPGLAAAAGGLVGLATQLAWLLDPAPRVNWLLVRAHTFSWAGWYHAAFLIVVSACTAGLACELLRRARAQPPPPWLLGGNGCALVVSAALLFLLTVVADSLPSAATASSRATMAVIALAPVAMLATAAMALGRRARVLAGPLLVGLAASVAAVCVVRGLQDGSPAAVVALAAGPVAGVATALARRPLPRPFLRSFLRSTDLRALASATVTTALIAALGLSLGW
ncbi:hypothetical protein ACFYUK_22195 [Nonomuraea wenchangensis]